MDLKNYFRIVPDFPKPGIRFYDVSTLLDNPKAFDYAVDGLAEIISGFKPDKLLGLESRGFLLTPVALKLRTSFGMIRKKGKLPGETLAQHYDLEYGSDTIEVQPYLIKKDARIVLIDDLLATGGTLEAATQLIRKAGAQVIGAACLIELEGLPGRERLEKLEIPFKALLQCPVDPPESDYQKPLEAL